MNLSEYQQAVNPVNIRIDELTSEMVAKVQELIITNGNDLEYLISNDDFDFFDQDGKYLPEKVPLSVKLFQYGSDSIYYSASDKKIVYFEPSEYGVDLPQAISEQLLKTMFEDKSLFEQALHVIGLSGILQASLTHRQLVLSTLSDNKAD